MAGDLRHPWTSEPENATRRKDCQHPSAGPRASSSKDRSPPTRYKALAQPRHRLPRPNQSLPVKRLHRKLDANDSVGACVAVVTARCRSLTPIGEHTTDLTAADLWSRGLASGQAPPLESTIRRVLRNLDPTGLNTRLRSWFCTRTGTIASRRVVAVDGKTMRGPRQGQASAPHLLPVLDHATGTVLTRERVANKSNQRSPPHRTCSSPSTWTGPWSPPTPCIPRSIPPSGSLSGVATTFSRLWATRRPCTALSKPCRGRTSRPPPRLTPDMGGGCDAPEPPRTARL